MRPLWLAMVLACFLFAFWCDLSYCLGLDWFTAWADRLMLNSYSNELVFVILGFSSVGLAVGLAGYGRQKTSQRDSRLMVWVTAACCYIAVFVFRERFFGLVPEWWAVDSGMGRPATLLSVLIIVLSTLLFAMPRSRFGATRVARLAGLLPAGVATLLYYSVFSVGLLGTMAGIFVGGTYPLLLIRDALPLWLGTPVSSPALVLAGIVLLSLGTAIVVVGFVQIIGSRGRRMVTQGLYSTVRHPQDLGIAVATFGAAALFASQAGPRGFMVWFSVVYLFLASASYEEDALARQYRHEYAAYQLRTPFIIPYVRTPIKLPGGWRKLLILTTLYPVGLGLMTLVLWMVFA